MQSVRNLLKLIVITGAVISLQACSNTYSAKAIEAWVVDADTKKPLEGVIVVANWELRYGLEGGGTYQLQVMETVTDKSGKFYFPAWGPKKIPEHLPSEARLKNDDPGLSFFYPNYGAVARANDKPFKSLGGHGESERTSVWNGKKIELKTRHATVKEYVFDIEGVVSNLHFIQAGRQCEWTLVPLMVGALIKENSRLKEAKVPHYQWPDLESYGYDSNCGSATEILKAFIQ